MIVPAEVEHDEKALLHMTAENVKKPQPTGRETNMAVISVIAADYNIS